MMRKKNIYLISHTHWDREWYLAREKFRLMLVELVDNLLEILDEGKNFKAFMLDGQTIVLEDYLEIKPENRERLMKYIKNGRILIGPWYVLPDELLISGEAHIRNYMLGDEVCRKFGKKMNIGYLPDAFGHPSQMPQIIRGLGMEELIFWRGVGPEITKTEFEWYGPDGSSVLAINMPFGYGTAACMPEDKEHFIRRFKKEARRLELLTDGDDILLMNGVDHLQPQAHIPKLLEICKGELQEYNIMHTTLLEFVRNIKKNTKKIQSTTGELRSSKKAYLLGGTISTRMYLKQKNHETEQLIEKLVEPISSIAWTLGKKYPAGEINQLWKYALSNLPHDSICGCSIDEVHREMLDRYKLLEELGNGTLMKSMEYISDNINVDKKGHEGAMVVFNPLGYARDEVVALDMDIRPGLIRKVDFDIGELVEYDYNRERKTPTGIRVFDCDGKEVAATLVNAIKVTNMKLSLDTQPEMYEALRLSLSFKANNVPSAGYDTYLYDLQFDAFATEEVETEGHIENDYFKIEPNYTDGTLNILDKINNKVFLGCNHFIDTADAGDEYTYSPCKIDHEYSIAKDTIAVTILKKDCIKQVMKIEGILRLPQALSDDRKSRCSNFLDCLVTTMITIYRDIPRIDIKTEIDNKAQDHRIRVLFPTGIVANDSESEGIFSVDIRPVTRSDDKEDYSDWIETPSGTHPQKSFVDVNDGKFGMTVANKGISEFQVIESASESIIALTLLRCVGWLSRPDLLSRKGNGGWTIPTPEAQCLGKHIFEYSIIPHDGSWRSSNSITQAHNFNTPLQAVVKQNSEGTVPRKYSIVELDSAEIVISAIKKSQDGEKLIVRLYNASNTDINAHVKINIPIERASLVTLDEKHLKDLEIQEGILNDSFKSWEIKTLSIKFR